MFLDLGTALRFIRVVGCFTIHDTGGFLVVAADLDQAPIKPIHHASALATDAPLTPEMARSALDATILVPGRLVLQRHNWRRQMHHGLDDILGRCLHPLNRRDRLGVNAISLEEAIRSLAWQIVELRSVQRTGINPMLLAGLMTRHEPTLLKLVAHHTEQGPRDVSGHGAACGDTGTIGAVIVAMAPGRVNHAWIRCEHISDLVRRGIRVVEIQDQPL